MSITDLAGSGTSTVREMSAGVDWITMIAEGRKNVEQLVESVRPIGREERARGEKEKPFRFMGYEGRMCGGVRLGFASGAAVAQLSGDVCNTSWNRLPPSCGRVTRLDLQTTVRLSHSRSGFARSLMSWSATTHRRRSQHRPRLAYSSDTSGLCIGTVGRRTSPRYARVYDKGVEQRTDAPGVRWRLELEAKKGLGEMLWEQLRTQQDVPTWCYSTLEASWRSWGLSWRLPACTALPDVVRVPERAPAAAVKLMSWLRTGVSPVIPRVLTVYSVEELLDALGLTHLAVPSPTEAEA